MGFFYLWYKKITFLSNATPQLAVHTYKILIVICCSIHLVFHFSFCCFISPLISFGSGQHS